MIDSHTAARFAAIALGHVTREYPHKLDHVLDGDGDALPPRVLHPVFFGSFDWHSCVHGWWTLLTLRRLHPQLSESNAITELAEASFIADNMAIEYAYLERPSSNGFERPYGWAWLLMLHLEMQRHEDRAWAALVAPYAQEVGKRLARYLTVMTYPIRTGTHANSAFAMILALDWADEFDAELAATIRQRSSDWFSADRTCQAWEPGGDEFLSSALCEALCMSRAHPDGFAQWFGAFLPNLGDGQPATLLTPAIVSDRSDGKIAHLDGLNLSRAWCWQSLAPRLASPVRAIANEAATRHFEAALPHIAGDYAGEHWLASFALLAMLAGADEA